MAAGRSKQPCCRPGALTGRVGAQRTRSPGEGTRPTTHSIWQRNYRRDHAAELGGTRPDIGGGSEPDYSEVNVDRQNAFV